MSVISLAWTVFSALKSTGNGKDGRGALTASQENDAQFSEAPGTTHTFLGNISL